MNYPEILMLSATAFIAGVVDSVAGGGGLIQIPALMLAGLSPQTVLGTNKCAMTLGTSVSVVTFWRKGKIYFPIIGYGIAFTLVGGFLGGKLVMMLDQAIVGKLMIGLLPMGLLALLMKRRRDGADPTLKPIDKWLKIPLICSSLGLYDGFFGHGTGSFLVMGFYMFLHRDLLESTANAKVFNWVSNMGALGVFLMNGRVLFHLALPMAAASMSGNYLGSRLAIQKGQGLIRGCLLGVLILLMVTLVVRFVL